VPSELGLEGHSDADVLAHAITDALLGAAGSRRYRNALSGFRPAAGPARQPEVPARTPWRSLSERGYRLVNVDATVILERPKLKDYRTAIREKLAATLGLDLDAFGEVQDRRGAGAGWAKAVRRRRKRW